MSRLEHEINPDELSATVPLLAGHGDAGNALARLGREGWSVVQADRSSSWRTTDPESGLGNGVQRDMLAILRATVGDLDHFGHLTPAEALACAEFVRIGGLPEDWATLDGDPIGYRDGRAVRDGR